MKKILNKFNITLVGNVTKTIKFDDIYNAAIKLKNNEKLNLLFAVGILEQTKLKCQNLKILFLLGGLIRMKFNLQEILKLV